MKITLIRVLSCNKESTREFVDLINILPHGVIRMNPQIPDSVQTSVSFSILTFAFNDYYITSRLFARSNSSSEMVNLRYFCLQNSNKQIIFFFFLNVILRMNLINF